MAEIQKIRDLQNSGREGGFERGAGFYCRTCEKVAARGEQSWILHLGSIEHQAVHSKNPALWKVFWDLEKTVEVADVASLTADQILRFLVARTGIVTDFTYFVNKKEGKIERDCCYALLNTQDWDCAEKFVNEGPHLVGYERTAVKVRFLTAEEKKKLTDWRTKVLENDERVDLDELDRSEEELAKSEEVGIKIVSVVGSAQATSQSPASKRKASEIEEERPFIERFLQMKIEEQIDAFIHEYGWTGDGDFAAKAVHFVDTVVGATRLRLPKNPFGDLTTSLGMKDMRALQLLVDVQDIIETKGANAKPVIAALIAKCSKVLAALKQQENLPFKLENILTADNSLRVNGVLDDGKDISLRIHFSNCIALQECRLQAFYCDFDCRILPLTFILAFWARSYNLLQSSKQTYPNQLIVLMTIAFLQHKKILPTVQKLMEAVPKDSNPVSVGGCNVSFCADAEVLRGAHLPPDRALLDDASVRAMSTLGMLKDWLQFYSEINLKENAICPRLGYFIPKYHFQPNGIENLPNDLREVYSNCQNGSAKKYLLSQTPLCIQNPFDLTYNCGRGVTPLEVQKFQSACKAAAVVVTSLVTSDHPDLTRFLLGNTNEDNFCDTGPSKKAKTDEIGRTISVPDDEIIPCASATTQVGVQENSKPSASSSTQNESSRQTGVAASAGETLKSIENLESSSANTKIRASAADFFSANSSKEEVKSQAIFAEHGEGDPSESVDIMEVESVADDDGESKDCTLRLNPTLFNFFAGSFAGTQTLKYEKIQKLTLQFLLDFNQKFWSNCLGLTFMPKTGQKFWPDDFATTSAVVKDGLVQSSGKTVMQRILEIKSAKEIDINFRVVADARMVHKLFLEAPENLTMKSFCCSRTLEEFEHLLLQEIQQEELDDIRQSHFSTPENPSTSIISFECRLLGAISSSFQKVTPLATLTIRSGADSRTGAGVNLARINVIKAIYKKLGGYWLNKMVQRWLLECSDFDRAKASEFIKVAHAGANGYANRKQKNFRGQDKQRKFNSSKQKIPVHNPRGPVGHLPRGPPFRQQYPPRFRTQTPPQQNLRPRNPNTIPLPPRGYQPLPPNFYDAQSAPQSYNTSQSFGNQFQYGVQPGNLNYSNYYGSAGTNAPERLLRNPGPATMGNFNTLQNFGLQSTSGSYLSNQEIQQNHTYADYSAVPATGYSQQQFSPNWQTQEGSTALNPPPLLPTPNKQPSSPLYFSRNFVPGCRPFPRIPRLQPFRVNTPCNEELNNAWHVSGTRDLDQASSSDGVSVASSKSSTSANFGQSLLKNPNFTGAQGLLQNPHFQQKALPNPNYVGSGASASNAPQPKPINRYFQQNEYNALEAQRQEPFESEFTRRNPPRGSRLGPTTQTSIRPRPPLPPQPRTNFERQGFERIPIGNFVPEHYGTGRPFRPKHRGFIKGGFLSTDKGGDDSDDDPIDIVWEDDPRGNSSPPPPEPAKNYKLGAPFPVPTLGRAKSPVSHISRHPGYVTSADYDRMGYVTAGNSASPHGSRHGTATPVGSTVNASDFGNIEPPQHLRKARLF